MDPLSVIASVLSIIDAATKLKESIGKVAKTRQSIRNVSDELVADLKALHNFCDAHKTALDDTAELKESLDHLKVQLFYVLDRCNRVFERRSKGPMGKVTHSLWTWKNADSLEADVKRLRESVQASMSRIQLYVSARSEMAITQAAHNVVVLKSDLRYHMNRVDELFGKQICEPGSSEFATVLGHSEPDDVDKQYIGFKLRVIVDALDSWTSTSVQAGPCRVINNRYIRVDASKEPMSVMETTLVPACRVITALKSGSTDSFISRCLDPVIDLASDLMYRGYNHIVYRMFEFATRILRQLVRHNDDDQLLFYLSWVLVQQQYICRPGPRQVALTHENVAVRRKLLRSPSKVFPRSLRLHWLHHSLTRLAYACYCNEDADQAIYHYQEALQLTDTVGPTDYDDYLPVSCELAGQYSFAFQSSPSLTLDFALAQATAYSLSLYAGSLRVLGRYSEAYSAGRDSITIFRALEARASEFPQDFNFLGHRLRWVQTHLPAWVDIIRNPDPKDEAENSGITDAPTEAEDNYAEISSDSGSHYVIEWGIAL